MSLNSEIRISWHDYLSDNLIPYHGGKSRMKESIIDLMPNHDHYCEPFVGGGSVFWSKKLSYLNSINDKKQQIINLYKTWSNPNYFDEFLKLLKSVPYAQAYYTPKTLKQDIFDAPDINEAVKFYYCILVSFAYTMESFGYAKNRPNSVTKKDAIHSHTKFWENKKLVLKRHKTQILYKLSKTQIFCEDFLYFCKRLDTEKTLFYFDPPYPNTRHEYYDSFDNSDFFRLLNYLPEIKGKFILSCNYHTALEKIALKHKFRYKELTKFGRFNHTSANKNDTKTKTEIIMTNFESNVLDKL